MHETSLMYDVLRTIEISASDNDIDEVTEIKLVIGNISTILPDALRFAFDSFKGHPPLAADARLILEERLPEVECRTCGEKYPFSPLGDYTCPRCGGYDVKLNGGEELYIEYYKGRERNDC